MFKQGQKVRVKKNTEVTWPAEPGAVGVVQSDDRDHDGLYYEVLFDPDGLNGEPQATWVNDYEIEAVNDEAD